MLCYVVCLPVVESGTKESGVNITFGTTCSCNRRLASKLNNSRSKRVPWDVGVGAGAGDGGGGDDGDDALDPLPL